jgi:hypothetical protein
MVFSVISNITIALLEMCCARNKPDKVMSIIQDMEDLAQEEIDRILRHHNRCRCY